MLDKSKELNNQTPITNTIGKLIVELEENDNGIIFKSCYNVAEDTSYLVREEKEKLLHPQLSPGATSSKALNGCFKSTEGKTESDFAALKPPNIISKNIPFFAHWFDQERIHSIESQTLPEFFVEKPSKSPEVYLKMRNFIIALYWHNPKAYLTASACRRAIRGDICGIMRVHAFLEHWGIINFCYKPASIGWNTIVGEKKDYPSLIPKGHRQENRSSSAKNLQKNKEYQKKSGDHICSRELFLLREDASQDISQENLGKFGSLEFQNKFVEKIFALIGLQRPNCIRCQKAVQAFWRFKKLTFSLGVSNSKENVFTLCEVCFAEENFPIFYSKQDFLLGSVFDLISSEKKDREWSIEEKTEVLRVLAKETDIEVALKIIIQHVKNRSLLEILGQILKSILLSDSMDEEKADVIRENQFTFEKSLVTKLDEKLSAISKLLGKEKKCSTLGDSHLHDIDFVRRRAQAINEFASKIELKLSFFEEFESIIQLEKQNLKVIL